MSLNHDPLSGPACFDRAVWRALLTNLGLPDQQARVLSCLLDGRSDKEIGASLGIGRPTVRTHLKRLFERLGAKSRHQLVACALQLASRFQTDHVILRDDGRREHATDHSRTDRCRP